MPLENLTIFFILTIIVMFLYLLYRRGKKNGFGATADCGQRFCLGTDNVDAFGGNRNFFNSATKIFALEKFILCSQNDNATQNRQGRRLIAFSIFDDCAFRNSRHRQYSRRGDRHGSRRTRRNSLDVDFCGVRTFHKVRRVGFGS